MKNHPFQRIHPLLAAVVVVAVVVVVLASAYGITRWASRGEVMGRVEVSGTEIGGLDRDQAISALFAVEDLHRDRKVTFTIEGDQVILAPAEAGFRADKESVADVALKIGREGNGAYQFLWWIRHIFATTTVPLTGATDPEAMDEIYSDWETEVIDMPPSLGAVVLEEGIPQPVYPMPGLGIDRSSATVLIDQAILSTEPEIVALPTATIIPRLTDADVDEALLEATRLIGQPITLVYNGNEVSFTGEQLAAAFRSRTIPEGSPQIIHFFDPEVIDTYLEPVRQLFEAEPVNAEFVIEEDEIRVEPGLKGTRIDENETAQRLLQAGKTTARLGTLPLVEDADPEITTEYLESLGIRHLVSSFTTYHPCCAPRVNNIQNMADTIDMHLMLPGDEFSLNGFVGQRTEEDGYVPAGTIVAGQLEDTVGGGVSQFATTFYNAVFWGAFEDVEHHAHSYYFSRYPEGIEATVNWRTPDLVFRNSYESALLIDTQHTRNSITVRFFGNNDGRIVKGEQSGSRLRIEIVAEGGPNALHVEGIVSRRYDETDPPEPLFIANPEFAVDQVEQLQEELGGWSVRVTRRILRGGTELVEEHQWTVRYVPKFAVFEVHPCMMPETEETCPSTTTLATSTTGG